MYHIRLELFKGTLHQERKLVGDQTLWCCSSEQVDMNECVSDILLKFASAESENIDRFCKTYLSDRLMVHIASLANQNNKIYLP